MCHKSRSHKNCQLADNYLALANKKGLKGFPSGLLSLVYDGGNIIYLANENLMVTPPWVLVIGKLRELAGVVRR